MKKNERALMTPEGTKDYMFSQTKKIRDIEDKLKQVFESAGYGEVMTPGIEFFDVFSENESRFNQENLYKTEDGKGKILVMRPDSTIPIARMISARAGVCDLPLKIYYNQPVYRHEMALKGRTNEIMQMGVEKIDVDAGKSEAEVLKLAVDVMKSAGLSDYRLEIGDIEIFNKLLDKIGADNVERDNIYSLVLSKNYAALKDELEKFDDKKGANIVMNLPRMFGGMEVLEEMEKLLNDYDKTLLDRIEYLRGLQESLAEDGYGEHVYMDLGLVNKVNYYTGLIFNGYAANVGEPVISGGRYDRLYRSMGENVCAVGFAVNTDKLLAASINKNSNADNKNKVLRIALTKGRLEKQVTQMLEKAGYDVSSLLEKGRKLLLPIGDGSLEVVLAKAPDVITYVEHGVCDLGVVGKDTIVENGGTFYEIMDLGVGKCDFALATEKGKDFYAGYNTKRIATKYPNVAKKYFNDKGIDVEIIKIEGSVELAPLLSLADAIVDIVETGTTLRENGLEVKEYIRDISARVIVNIASMKMRKDEVHDLLENLEKGMR